MKKEINFSTMIGDKASLYTCTDINCFQLGSVKFEVLEDESDGYRSAMDTVVILTTDANKRDYLGEVIIEQIDSVHKTGYQLRDIDKDHIWLTFGTDNFDDWYPSFMFLWNPWSKELKEEEIRNIKDLIK